MKSLTRYTVVTTLVLTVFAWASTSAQDKPTDQSAKIRDLITQMAKDDFAGREASRALSEIGKPAVEPLIEALKSEAPRVRYWAIAALSGIGDDRAIAPIKDRLKDPDQTVRAVAVWHLGRWFDHKDVQDAVLSMLDEKNKFVRGWALNLVTEKHFMDALPKVLGLLKSDDEETRYDALHAVTVLKGQDALDLLKSILKEDKSAFVRECAVRSCTLIKPPTPRTAEVLIEGLSDAEESVRKAASQLLLKGFDQSFGYRADDTVGSREKAVWQWRTWYRLNKDKLRWDETRRVFVIGGGEKKQEIPKKP